MHKKKLYKSNIQNKSGRMEQKFPIKIALQKINELQKVKVKSKPKKIYFIPPKDDIGPEDVYSLLVNPFLKTAGSHPIEPDMDKKTNSR